MNQTARPITDNQKLIPTKELIEIAKKAGVKFGHGNPNNRLRYFTKIGLLPHAQRKQSGNHDFTEGHYPDYVVELLLSIQNLKRANKTSSEIAKTIASQRLKYEVAAKARSMGEALTIKIPPASFKFQVSSFKFQVRRSPVYASAGIVSVIFLALVLITTPNGQTLLSRAQSWFAGKIISSTGKIAGIESPSISSGQALLLPIGENILANPSFENPSGTVQTDGQGKPKFGQAWRFGYLEMAHSGNFYVSNESIRSGTLAMKVWDSIYDAPGAKTMNLGISQKETTTINGRNYILSVFIRSKDLVGNPKLRLGFKGEKENYQDYDLSNLSNWTNFSFSYENAPLGAYPSIEIVDYQGGMIYLDDAGLTEMGSEMWEAGYGDEKWEAGNLTSHFSLLTSRFSLPTSNFNLGSGSIKTDASADLHPADDSMGSLGMENKRFATFFVNDADVKNTFKVGGPAEFLNNLKVQGAATISGNLTIQNSRLILSSSRFESDLFPWENNRYNLGDNTTPLRFKSGFFNTSLVVNNGTNNITTSPNDISFSGNSSLTLGGNLKIGADALYISAASGNVGIGNTSPANKLTVTGNLDLTGNLGIGTTSPASVLSVNGGISAGTYFGTAAPSGGMIISGNVGIGTTNPGAKLDVNGTLTVTGNNLTTLGGNLTVSGTAWTATPTISGLITATSGLTSGSTLTVNSNFLQTTSVNNGFAGNVGIGTTVPLNKLDVSGSVAFGSLPTNALPQSNSVYFSGNLGIGMTNPGQAIDLGASAANLTFSHSTGPHQILTGGTTDLALMPGGNLGIGTTAPVNKLTVSGNQNITGSLGIGTTAPSASLDIIGNLSVSTYATVSASLGIGTTAAAGPGNLNLAGNLTVGTNTTNTLTVNSFVTSDLTPQTGSLYNLGSTSRRWSNVWADTVTASNISGTVVTGSTSANDWLINSDNATADTEAVTLTFERGTPAVNAEIRWDSTNKWLSTNVPTFNISPDSGITASGKSALIVNQIQNQDILSASASGTTRLVLTNAGNLGLAGNLGIGTTSPAYSLDLALASAIFNLSSATGVKQIQTGGTTNLALMPGGNLGIGTTSPLALLHVSGQCVTGDTLLKRRRRRKNKKGEWEEDWEDIRIDQIQESDEILTLDEETGEFVVSKVKGLMDMGTKTTFKLVTEAGKEIRTTAEHPYLVNVEGENQRMAFAFVDESGITKDPHQKFFAVAAFVPDGQELAMNRELREIHNGAAGYLNEIEEFFEFKFKYITKKSLPFYRKIVKVLEKYNDHWYFDYRADKQKQPDFWKQYLSVVRKLLMYNHSFKFIVLADYLDKPKGSHKDLSSLETSRRTIGKTLQIDSQGSMFLQIADILLGAVLYTKRGKEDQYKGQIAKKVMELLKAKEKAVIDPIYAANGEDDLWSDLQEQSIARLSDLSRGNIFKTLWRKVSTLKPGMLIATVDGWEKIVSIGKIGQEQVYDIEIANTHNFVANGIVAHNTYLSGNLGVGTTSPGGSLEIASSVTAASAGTYYTGKLNNTYSGTMNSATPVTSVYGIYNRPNIGIGGTAPQLTNLFVDYVSGNIGVGTTSQVTNLYGLYVANPTTNGGSTITNNYGLYLEDQTAGTTDFSLYSAGGTNYFAGNVGIGTTSPLALLHVAGQCVTGDTLLLRRRRRRKGKNGEWLEEWEEVRIDEIESGDEILTLDENTHEFIVSKVKALMNMGTKTTFKLTTNDSKTIRTTAEHPYLIRDLGNVDTNFFHDLTYQTLESLGRKYYHRALEGKIIEVKGLGKVNFSHEGFEHIVYEKKSKLNILSRVLALPKIEALFLNASEYTYYRKQDVNGENVEYWQLTGTIDGVKISVIVRSIAGGSKHFYSVVWRGFEKENVEGAVSGSSKEPPQRVVTLQRRVHDLIVAFIDEMSRSGIASPSVLKKFLKVKWVKIRFLKPGMEIATVGSDGQLSWQKIEKIEKVGEEEVFDIEVENTHNFVGNGIVAHNTYISGNVGIGTTAPTAYLHLKAGTTAASTAPLKFTSGSLNTTAEAGAVEFLTDDFYATITTGAARKSFVLTDGTNLTSGRVSFATTNGRLVDDADLTFSTDTLSATKLLSSTSVSTPSLISTGAVGITPAAGSNLNVSLSTTGDFAVNTNQLYVDTSAGNLGIGTTSPLALLHVAGQCVTGDTLLRRRRRRKNKKGEWEEDWEDIRIDQIQEGDEILTLDEKTGGFVVSKVKNLMDMGTKNIIKITTTSGKTIRTTAEHPYLVNLEPSNQEPITNFLYSQILDETALLARSFYEKVLEGTGVYSPALSEEIEFTHEGWNHIYLGTRTKFEILSRYFGLPKALFVLGLADKLIEPKPRIIKRKDRTIYYWAVQGIVEGAWIRVIIRQVGKGKKHFYSLVWKGEEEKKEVKKAMEKGVVSRLNPRFQAFAFNAWDNYSKFVNDLSRGKKIVVRSQKWVKVKDLTAGKMIATVDGWEEIKKIEHLPAEQVYDIEVENTHNFVGNGIVAHNTYISGNVGIGTTAPTAYLHLKAGTTAASTAPLKFTSGSLNTTAEAGAVEFLTDDFYATITTGAARKSFVLTDGTNLTSGRVSFATTNGRLVDDADLTFSTDTLSATKLLSSTSVSTPSLISTGAVGITPAAGSNLNVSLSTTGDFAVNTNQLYVDTSAGNVGIGTTSPLALLHVAGECVVGETLLPIKRRKKKTRRRQGYGGQGNGGDDEWEDLLVPIKDVREGDLVASLDEESSEIVYRPIRKLMNKGFQKVVKITTADGRSIETTFNHPYLVQVKNQKSKIKITSQNSKIEENKWFKVSELKVGDKIAVPETRSQKTAFAFIDASNMIYRDTDKNPWKIDLKKLIKYLRERFGVSRVLYFAGVDNRNEKQLKLYQKMKEWGYELRLNEVKNFVNAKGEFYQKADVDARMAFEIMKYKDEYDQAVFITGDGDFYWLFEYFVKEIKRKSWLMSSRGKTARELRQLFAHRFINFDDARRMLEYSTNKKEADPFNVSTSGLTGSIYQKANDLSSSKIVFEEIISIEETGRKEVFDIEVEGTHNFVGNDILAHNTYLSGNLGIGTTAPTALLHLGIGSTAVVGQKIVLASGATANAFEVNTSTGVGGNLVVMQSNGNVGIGTTGPTQLLAVGSTSQFNVSSTGAVVGVGINSGSGLLQGTGGLTVTGTGNLNATGTSATNIGNSTGVLTLASGGASGWTNTSGDLTLKTATSGNVLLSSIGNVGIGSTAPAAAPFLFVGSTGNVGMGTTAPGAKLDINGTLTITGSNLTTLGGNLTVTGTAWTATPTISGLITATSGLTSNSTLTVQNNSNFIQTGSGTFGTGTGAVSLNGETTIASGKNLALTSGLLTQTGSGNNSFAGNLGIGTTAPTAYLHLKAGTTAASTAPLKFTSGSLNTTAEAGAVEFLTDAFYGTITTGAARKTFAFLESPSFTTPTLGAATYTTLSGGNITDSGLTAGRVTFAGTGGLLSDDADLTFSTDTLSATKLLSSTSVSTPSLISTGAVGITPAAGSNLNVSLSTTGDFAVNTNQLYVDTSAGNVGIGTTSPSALLHLGIGSTAVVGQKIVLASGATANAFEVNTSSGVGGDKFVILAGGNIGIGVTTPAAKLHVLGQCVAIGTRIRRRRKGKNGEWLEEEVPVEDIQSNDEVLTLNEQTGEFEWHKVEKVMNKGKQKVFGLKTGSGKYIKTTAEHPYLVQVKPPKVTGTEFEVDISGRIEEMNKDSFVALANKNDSYVIKVSARVKRLLKMLHRQKHTTKFGFQTYAHLIKMLILFSGYQVTNLKIDHDYSGNEPQIQSLLQRVYPRLSLEFVSVGKGSRSDLAAGLAHSKGIGINKILTVEEYLENKKETPVAFKEATDATDRQGCLLGSPSHRVSQREYHNLSKMSRPKLLGETKWIKVRALKPGNRIATIEGWDTVIEIKELERVPTYDLQISQTHNFVANGIVAHNTYLQGADQLNTSFSLRTADSTGADKLVITNAGNVGIGTTAPLSMLSVGASSQFQVSSTGDITTSSTGELTIGGTGNSSIAGNVGIGTTGPLSPLDIAKVGQQISGNFYAPLRVTGGISGIGGVYLGYDSSDTGSGVIAARSSFLSFWSYNGTTWGERVRIDNQGNVGIGTTGPGGKLDVRDGSLYLTDADVAHSMTAQEATNAYGVLKPYSGTAGGLYVRGLSDGDNTGLVLDGMIGVNNPTDTVPAILLNAYKYNAGSSVDPLGNAETVLQVANSNTALVSILGSGNVGIGTTGPGGKFEVYGDVGRYIRTGATGFGLTLKTNDNSIQSQLTLENTQIDAADQGDALLFNLGTGGAAGVAGTTVAGGKIITASEQGWTGVSATHDSYMQFQTALNGTLTDQVRITSNGNVGIGTTSPSALLHLGIGSTAVVGQKIVLASGATANAFEVNTSTGVGGNLVVMQSTGNVGIGTTGPGSRLYVAGDSGTQLSVDGTIASRVVYYVGGTPKAEMGYGPTAYGGTHNTGGYFMSSDDITLGAYAGSPYVTVKATTGNVGIGTTSPSALLHLGIGSTAVVGQKIVLASGATANAFEVNTSTGVGGNLVVMQSNGNVGIGTTGPGALLHVSKSQSSDTLLTVSNVNAGTGARAGLRATNDDGTGNINIFAAGTGYTNIASWTDAGIILTETNLAGGMKIVSQAGGIKLSASGNEANDVFIATTGNVGIGTTGPGMGNIGVDNILTVKSSAYYASMELVSGYGDDGAAVAYLNFIQNANLATYKNVAAIATYMDVSGTATKRGANLRFYTQADNTAGATENMRLSSTGGLSLGSSYVGTNPGAGNMIISGNVGIGTTGPGVKLHVVGDDSGNIARFVSGVTNAATLDIQSDASAVYFGSSSSSDDLILRAGGLAGYEWVTIKSSGNVGIGTTGPSEKLAVDTVSAGTQRLLTLRTPDATGNNAQLNFSVAPNTSSDVARIYTAYTAAGSVGMSFWTYGSAGLRENVRIDKEGNVGIGTTGPRTILDLGDFDGGDGVVGRILTVGRNTNATNTGAGAVNFLRKDGTNGYTWQDNAGNLRIGATAPNNANDTSGTVVGAQTSSLDAKNIISQFTDYAAALSYIINNTALYNFTYKSGSFNNQEFTGIVTDYSPVFGMDRDAGHPAGKSLNVITGLGYTFGAIKALDGKIASLSAELAAASAQGYGAQSTKKSPYGDFLGASSSETSTSLIGSSELIRGTGPSSFPSLTQLVSFVNSQNSQFLLWSGPEGNRTPGTGLDGSVPNQSGPTQLLLSDILVSLVNNEASLSAKLDDSGNLVATVFGKFEALNSKLETNSNVLNSNVQNISDFGFRISDLEVKYATLSAQLATASASLSPLSDLGNLETATVSGALTVLGKTTLANLGVTGRMTIGLLVIDGLTSQQCNLPAGRQDKATRQQCESGSSLSTLSGPLRLQDTALANLEMMAGKIVIDTKGNLTVQGTITAKSVETENLKVLGAASAGSASLPVGQTELEIMADAATDSARILLTPTTLTDKILTVTKKEIGKFVVAIAASASADLKFDWFIVGN